MVRPVPTNLFLRIVQGCTLISSESKGCSLDIPPIICNETVCARCRRVSVLIRAYSCGHYLCQACSRQSYNICICCKDSIQDSVLLIPPIDRMLSSLGAIIQCPYSISCRGYYSLAAYLNHIHTEHYVEAYLAFPAFQPNPEDIIHRATDIQPVSGLAQAPHAAVDAATTPETPVLSSSTATNSLDNIAELFCTTASVENLTDDGRALTLRISGAEFIGQPGVLKTKLADISDAISLSHVFSCTEHQSIVGKSSNVCSASDFHIPKTNDSILHSSGNVAHLYNVQWIHWYLYSYADIPPEARDLKVASTILGIHYTPHLSHLFIHFLCHLPSVETIIIDNSTFHLTTQMIIHMRNKGINLKELYIFDCTLDLDLNILHELRSVWLPTVTTMVVSFSVLARTFADTYLELLSCLACMHLSNFIGYNYIDFDQTLTAGKHSPAHVTATSGSVPPKKKMSFLLKDKNKDKDKDRDKDKGVKNCKPFVLQRIERSTILLNSTSERHNASGPSSVSVPIPISYAPHNHSFSKDCSSYRQLSCDECGQGSEFDVLHVSEDINIAAISPPMFLIQYHSSICQRYGIPLGLIHYPISSDIPFKGSWGSESAGSFVVVFDGVPYDISEVASVLLESSVIAPLIPAAVLKTNKAFTISYVATERSKTPRRKDKVGKKDKDHDSRAQRSKQSLIHLFHAQCSPPAPDYASGSITFSNFAASVTPELLNLYLLLFLCRYDISLEHVEVLVLNLSENLSRRKGITDYVLKSLALRNNAEVEQILEQRTGLSLMRRKDGTDIRDSTSTKTMEAPVPASVADDEAPAVTTQYDAAISMFLESILALMPYLPSLRGIKLGVRSSSMTLLLPPHNGAIYTSLLRLIFVTARRLISIAPTVNYILPLLTGVERFKSIKAFYANTQAIYEMIRGEYFNSHYRTLTSLLEDGRKVGALEMASSSENDTNGIESPGRTFTSLCNASILSPGGKDLVYGNEIDSICIEKPFRTFRYSVSSFDFQYDLETTMPPVHPQQLVDLYGPLSGSLKQPDPTPDTTYVFAHLHNMLQQNNLPKLCFMDLLPLFPPRTVIYCLNMINEGSGHLLSSSFDALEFFSIPCSKFFLTDSVPDPTVTKLETLQTIVGFRRSDARSKSESTMLKTNKYYNMVKYRYMLDKSVYSKTLMAQYRFIRYDRRLRPQHKHTTITISKPVLINNSYIHYFLNISFESLSNLYMGSKMLSKGQQSMSRPETECINVLVYLKEIIGRFVVGYTDINLLTSLCTSAKLIDLANKDTSVDTAVPADAKTAIHTVENENEKDNMFGKQNDLIEIESTENSASNQYESVPNENEAFKPDNSDHDKQSAVPLSPRQPPQSAATKKASKSGDRRKESNLDGVDLIQYSEDHISEASMPNAAHPPRAVKSAPLVALRLESLSILNFDGIFYYDIGIINRLITLRLQRIFAEYNLGHNQSLIDSSEPHSPPSRGHSTHTLSVLMDKYAQDQEQYQTYRFNTIERFITMLLAVRKLYTDSTIINMIMMERNVLLPQTIQSTSGTTEKQDTNRELPKPLIQKLSSPYFKTPKLGMQFAPNIKTTRFAIDSSAVGTLSEVRSQVTSVAGDNKYTNSIVTIVRRRDCADVDVDEAAHIVFGDRGPPRIHALDIPSIDGLSIITTLHNEEEGFTSTLESPYAHQQQALADSLELGQPNPEQEVVALQDPSIDFPTLLHDDSPYQVTPNLRGYVASQRPVALLTICKPLLYYYTLFKLLLTARSSSRTLSQNEQANLKGKGSSDNLLIDSPIWQPSDYIVLPIGGASFEPKTWSTFNIFKSASSLSNSTSSGLSLHVDAIITKRISTKLQAQQGMGNLSDSIVNTTHTLAVESQDEVLISIHLAYMLLYFIYKYDASANLDTGADVGKYPSFKKPQIVLLYGAGKLFKCPDTTISARLLAFIFILLINGILTDVIVDSDVLLRFFPTSMAYNAYILNTSIVSKLYRNGTLILGWDNTREGVDIPLSLYLQLFTEISASQPAVWTTKPLIYLDLSGTLTNVPAHSIYDMHNYSELQFCDFLTNIRKLDKKIGFLTIILPVKVLQIAGIRKIYRLADIVAVALSCTRLQNVIFSSACSVFKIIDDGSETRAGGDPAGQFNCRPQIKSLLALKLGKSSTLHIYNENWSDALVFLNYIAEKCKTIFHRVCILDFTAAHETADSKAVVEAGRGLFNRDVSLLVLKLISHCVGVDKIIIPSLLIEATGNTAMEFITEWIEKTRETRKLQEIALSPSNERLLTELKQRYPDLSIS